jgi:altronate hydrolase
MKTLVLNPLDDVAVLLEDAGGIAAGHKVAVNAVRRGEPVRKYGQVIGRAAADLMPGEWVHTHNLVMSEDPRDAVTGADIRPVTPAGAGTRFQGYRRQDGRGGTRNHVLILTSVNCSAAVARKIAASFPDEALPAGVDGVTALTHSGGCGGASDGFDVTLLRRTLAGYARNPNVDGILIVGLGCEANQIPGWLEAEGLESGPGLRTLSIQEAGGTLRAVERGRQLVTELVAEAARKRREPLDLSCLCVGLQCGGSDGWSGITANPALGAAMDRLIAGGGTALLSETPEIWGAEHLLLRRAESTSVADELIARLDWWRDHAARQGMELNNNPSPGNLKGGITTILEKSLGAVAKSGGSPLVDVIGYAQPVRKPGLTFMDSPGYDPCSATGQIASGANLIAFTTGRGSVFGSRPAPCLKIASNASLAQWMDEDIDVDASPILTGTSVTEMGDLIFARLLAIASGDATRSELLGMGGDEFVPWQKGAYL